MQLIIPVVVYAGHVICQPSIGHEKLNREDPCSINQMKTISNVTKLDIPIF